jgi:hypothetical protein
MIYLEQKTEIDLPKTKIKVTFVKNTIKTQHYGFTKSRPFFIDKWEILSSNVAPANPRKIKRS